MLSAGRHGHRNIFLSQILHFTHGKQGICAGYLHILDEKAVEKS